MAAGTCIERGLDVLMLDKNEQPGRKLRITGKGRCNVTNNCPPEEVLKEDLRARDTEMTAAAKRIQRPLFFRKFFKGNLLFGN